MGKGRARHRWTHVPWGNTWDATRCNSLDGGLDKTSPVGSYPSGASPYGVLDMAGNVDQFCFDWNDMNYYTTGPTRNPTGPKEAPAAGGKTAPSRIRRGGSFTTETRWIYSAHRNGIAPSGYLPKIGFRMVIPLAE